MPTTEAERRELLTLAMMQAASEGDTDTLKELHALAGDPDALDAILDGAGESEEDRDLRESQELLEALFTGIKPDKNGVKRRYVNGRQVAFGSGSSPEPEDKSGEPPPAAHDLHQRDPDHPVAKSIREDTEARSTHAKLLALARANREATPDVAEAQAKLFDAIKMAKMYRQLNEEAKNSPQSPETLKMLATGWAAAEKDVLATFAERDAAEAEHARLRAELRAKIHAELKQPDAGEVSFRPASAKVLRNRPLTEKEIAGDKFRAIQDGMAWAAQLLGGPQTHDIEMVRASRAFMLEDGDRKILGATPAKRDDSHEKKAAVGVHEFGHFIDIVPGVVVLAKAFLAYRTRGELPLTFDKAMPGHGYGRDEEGFKDDFAKAFGEGSAYYVGKRYPGDPATELISMGLQKLYEDPTALLENDPEYATFLFKALRLASESRRQAATKTKEAGT